MKHFNRNSISSSSSNELFPFPVPSSDNDIDGGDDGDDVVHELTKQRRRLSISNEKLQANQVPMDLQRERRRRQRLHQQEEVQLKDRGKQRQQHLHKRKRPRNYSRSCRCSKNKNKHSLFSLIRKISSLVLLLWMIGQIFIWNQTMMTYHDEKQHIHIPHHRHQQSTTMIKNENNHMYIWNIFNNNDNDENMITGKDDDNDDHHYTRNYCAKIFSQPKLFDMSASSSSSTKHHHYQSSSFPIGTPAYTIWDAFQRDIIRASMHPKTPKKIVKVPLSSSSLSSWDIHRSWIEELLSDLLQPSSNMEQGIRSSFPPQHDSTTTVWQPIVEKLVKRWEYLLLSLPSSNTSTGTGKKQKRLPSVPPPPVKIVVFGGSIVEGTGCDRLPPHLIEEHDRRDNDSNKKDNNNLSSGSGGGFGNHVEYDSVESLLQIPFDTFQECSWPYRLEYFIHFLFERWTGINILSNQGKGNSHSNNNRLVEVHNLAVGGTHSEAAIPVLKYWLSPAAFGTLTDSNGIDNYRHSSTFPHHPRPADIIINAYSANDNLPPAYHGTKNTTIDNYHLYRIFKRNQDFIYAANQHVYHHQHQQSTTTSTNDCFTGENRHQSPSPPVILYVNDYLGNQQDSIWGDGQLDEMIQLLSDYSTNVAYISTPHISSIKHWVMADTEESFFSGEWKRRRRRRRKKKKQSQSDNDNINTTTNDNDDEYEYQINVHFGMAGHVMTMLAIAYTFLDFTVKTCEEEYFATTTTMATTTIDHNDDNEQKKNILTDCEGDVGGTVVSNNLNHHVVNIDLPDKEWVQSQQPQLDVVVPFSIEEMSFFMSKSISTRSLMNVSIDATRNLIHHQNRHQHRPQTSFGCSQRYIQNGITTTTTTTTTTATTSTSSDTSQEWIPPCTFAFLAAPLGTHQQRELLNEYIQRYVIVNDGWVVQNDFRHGGFQNKLGWVATKLNATVTLQVPHPSMIASPLTDGNDKRKITIGNNEINSNNNLRMLTVHYLKSYGPEWQDSKVQFIIEFFATATTAATTTISKNFTHQFELEGYHNQSVSVSYFHQVDLWEQIFQIQQQQQQDGQHSYNSVRVESMKLKMTLIQGTMFKMNALMICSH